MNDRWFIVPPDPDNPDAHAAPTAEQLAAATDITPFLEQPQLPELLTADDSRVRACTAGGVGHDYRTHVEVVTLSPGKPGPAITRERTYLRCVWCHAVTCGNADETDPCIEPYHHRVPHRTRMGVTWPIGGNRP